MSGFWEPDPTALVIREPRFLVVELADAARHAARAAESDHRSGVDRTSRLYLRLALPLPDYKAGRLLEFHEKLKRYTEKIVRAIYHDDRTIDRYFAWAFSLPELHAEATAILRSWALIVESDGIERPVLAADIFRLSSDEIYEVINELLRAALSGGDESASVPLPD